VNKNCAKMYLQQINYALVVLFAIHQVKCQSPGECVPPKYWNTTVLDNKLVSQSFTFHYSFLLQFSGTWHELIRRIPDTKYNVARCSQVSITLSTSDPNWQITREVGIEQK
jgi:hypothetical protein